jgi:hypothetical protein
MGWRGIAAGTDLLATMREIVAAALERGWSVEDPQAKYGAFFCQREKERLLVTLQPTPPQNPLSQWELPAEAATVADCFI